MCVLDCAEIDAVKQSQAIIAGDMMSAALAATYQAALDAAKCGDANQETYCCDETGKV